MESTHDIAIRQFTLADLEQVTELETVVYGSGGYGAIVFRQLYDLFPSLLWVAADGPKVIGHVCGAIAAGGEIGWILNFAVQAHYRRQGIGLRLLQKGIVQLLAAGVRTVRITAETENHAALRLYRTLGFREVGLEGNYYGDGLDRLVFELGAEGR